MAGGVSHIIRFFPGKFKSRVSLFFGSDHKKSPLC